jgi:hypothetical protein
MLRVSIHAGPLRTMSRFNRLDWLDIGYNELGPLATYKVVLFKIGEGVVPPVYLPSYPRGSSSLWDLTARSIARSLYPDARNPEESVPPTEHALRRPAFAEAICAVIEHIPNSGVASLMASIALSSLPTRCRNQLRRADQKKGGTRSPAQTRGLLGETNFE